MPMQNRMPPVMRPPTSAPPVNAISSAQLAALQNQMHQQQNHNHNQNQIRQNLQHAQNIAQNAHHAQNLRGVQSPLIRSPVVSPGPPRPRKNRFNSLLITF
jgi:hypothetical protein